MEKFYCLTSKDTHVDDTLAHIAHGVDTDDVDLRDAAGGHVV